MSLTDQQLAILKVVLNAEPKLRKAILQYADKNLVQTICECVLNVLLGNVQLDESQKKKFSKHKSLLRKIVKKKGNWKIKKKLLQKGGSFLIPLLAPVLGSLLSNLL
ncbi:hypothetical protein B566_EDAN013835 [Ephemera danica]|nr:hypothetical protein B566_EDAN013835 [Ephemera danica]